ncbi:MAG: fasciclin domain-containing protein [Bacteroidaceae bacterium]|nr:fasciclin domain-containing protein [Bacteroidaceae bacterium]
MKTIIKYSLFMAVAVVMTATFFSCDDDPGVDNYYTSTKQYASDFLKSKSQFSEFVKAVERSHKLDLIGTYGQYTIFAPTNAAIDEYLRNKNVSSVEELSQVDCDTLVLNHIIEEVAYFTTDYSDGVYPHSNMCDRFLTITCDSIIPEGQNTPVMRINKKSIITHPDDSVANGVVHTIDRVIDLQNEMLPALIDQDSTATLFATALYMTGLDRLMQDYIDTTYHVGSDSIDWTNDKLVLSTANDNERDNVAYMEKRFFKYTAFVETDDVMRRAFIDVTDPSVAIAKYGKAYDVDYSKCQTGIDSLRAMAAALYDDVYPEDAQYFDDLTNRSNSLNRFISYHLLPFSATYYQLTCVDGENTNLPYNFNRRKYDIADWYETMMPYALMKFSFPSGSQSGLYINRRGVMSRADERGVKIPGTRVLSASESLSGKSQTAVNGLYHYIDDIVFFGEQTQERVIGGERMRFDACTLSPDFMTSGARGHYTRSTVDGGRYGTGGQHGNAATNTSTCLGFKPGSAKNFTFTDATHMHVRNRFLTFWSYQGDELLIKGRYDFTFKLPPLPEGTYELRLQTCVGFNTRGIVQVYLDGKPCGIPFDMRPSGDDARIGWKSDTDLGDDDAITQFDKSFHNRGWMKGMDTYASDATNEGSKTFGTSHRDQNNTIRKVITQFHTNGHEDHFVRMQQMMESETNEFAFDFIELCPSSVYNNEYYAEDRH